MASQVKLSKSYLHVPGKLPFIGITAGQLLYEMATKYPNKEMYVFYDDNERITFTEMKEKVCFIYFYSLQKLSFVNITNVPLKEE